MAQIKVFALDDVEWWAGESLAACLEAARADAGEDCYANAELQREMSAEAMQELTFIDEGGVTRTFAAELQRRVDDGESFPQLFAATEF